VFSHVKENEASSWCYALHAAGHVTHACTPLPPIIHPTLLFVASKSQTQPPLQEAAGMFAHVKENEASKIDNPRPVDLTPECLSMMEKLMLAQAQVCVWWVSAGTWCNGRHKCVLRGWTGTCGLLTRAGTGTGLVRAVGVNSYMLQTQAYIKHAQAQVCHVYDVITIHPSARHYVCRSVCTARP
jgi:hypothetical protein